MPFEDKELNLLEIFNEVTILVAGIHLLLLTDYDINYYLQYNLGWSLISVTSLNIFVNMIITTIVTVKRAILFVKKLRFYYHLQKLKR